MPLWAEQPQGVSIGAVSPPNAGPRRESPPILNQAAIDTLRVKPMVPKKYDLTNAVSEDAPVSIDVRATAVKIAGFLNATNEPVDGVVFMELAPGCGFHLCRDGDVWHFQPMDRPRIWYPAQANVTLHLSFWTDHPANPLESQRP